MIKSLNAFFSFLAAHDGKAKERAADYHKINQGLNLPKKVLGFNKSSAANLNSEGEHHSLVHRCETNLRKINITDTSIISSYN